METTIACQGLYKDNGKEHGRHHRMLAAIKWTMKKNMAEVCPGLQKHSGQENGDHHGMVGAS